ncbi:MAG: pilus assembly protein TadG-related protein [Gemmatimonadota bacterium]|nr:pilus assembly protein TadG-related protein [Gemmatimonadota bacterium]
MISFEPIGRLRGDDRGGVGVFVAIGLTVFIGSAAMAIDMGHALNVRTESQRVADLAAMAGVAAFIHAPGNIDPTARAWATQFAAQNTVDQQVVTLNPAADVEVDLVNERVRVTVHHTVARGNPVQTIFARVLGINTLDVVTTAVAQATPALGVNCVLPLLLADRWEENGAPGDPDYYDPGIDDYEAWNPDGSNDDTYTGYSQDDIGTIISIKHNTGPGDANPSWYYPIAAGGLFGGANYREHIYTCPDNSGGYYIGQQLPTEPGNMVGPTNQGFDLLVDMDPTAQWDFNQNCIVTVIGETCRGSPRLRPMPMFDPTDTPDPGRKPATITNFAGVFVLGTQGNSVNVVFAGYTAFQPAGGGNNASPTPFKFIRLVE